MELRRKMLHQVGEGGVNRLLSDQVVVIQDQEKLLRLLCKTIDEYLQDGAQWRGLLGLQVGHKLCAEPWLLAVQSCKYIHPELHLLIVSLIQRYPRYPRAFWWQRLYPGREQSGFTETSRGRNQRQWVFQARVEQLNQAMTGDQHARGRRDKKLRCQKLVVEQW